MANHDGSASIYYGAMPRWVNVPAGTFRFERLAKKLRAKSYSQSAEGAVELPGGLFFSDSTELLVIDEYRLFRSLIERAWQARELPKTPQEAEDAEWISKACAL